MGSVFRAIVLGSLSDSDTDIWKEFYKKHDFQNKVVLDPFMGSGTTLGEAVKLGARVIGCDINPISTFAVRQALTRSSVDDLIITYRRLEEEVQPHIAKYYTTIDPDTGESIPVLYHFWVKEVETPNGETYPLFSSYVFSRNAYPKRKPQAQIICPECWAVNIGRYDAKELTCQECNSTFNPQDAPANGQYVKDRQGIRHKIKDLLPKDGSPLRHRLYAMMALRENGEKIYLAPQTHDFELLEDARERLGQEELPLPTMEIRPGHNTNQARGYNYTEWREFFNERQLLCLGLLLRRILEIEDDSIKDQFLCLFSSTLEFNNMFCSFKGEGTGAVRHMFSHHILKPERTPLENSVWGTNKSSGTFSSLFRSRLLKAKTYLDDPTEIYLQRDVFGNPDSSKSTYIKASEPISVTVTDSWQDFDSAPDRAVVLNGDSACLPIPNESVDAIVTDPPYFDFLHYSELSDFFFAWLAPVVSIRHPYFNRPTSYHQGEVQNKDKEEFAISLGRVFKESYRVLKSDGVLVFSFHHSRPEGWTAIYKALHDADMCVVAVHPVYAEMSVASSKSSAKEPISLDMLLVCRKCTEDSSYNQRKDESVDNHLLKLKRAGMRVSKADIFNIRASMSLTSASADCLTVSQYHSYLQKVISRCN